MTEEQHNGAELYPQPIDPEKLRLILDGRSIMEESDASFDRFLEERTVRDGEGEVVEVVLGESGEYRVGVWDVISFDGKPFQVTGFPVMSLKRDGLVCPPILLMSIRKVGSEGPAYIFGRLSHVDIPQLE